MERQPVQSCILRSVGYDDAMKNLEIEFHSGLVFQYSGVPAKVYTDLMSSSIVGKYFSDHVRNRFRSKKIVV
ncbi:MAG TPA: KTSC domain-containing protein [Methanoregula sp.]|nr:KTSC domain-containing protein [Methanoregula sp.]